MWDFNSRGLGFGVWGLGFGVWGLGFGVWGLGFGVWGISDQRLRLRQITDEVMFEIRELTGQDYVNEYAGKSAAPSPGPTIQEAVVPEMPERRSSADVLKPIPA